jgi:transcription termination factor NusB
MAAFATLQAVSEQDAYANLVLPRKLAEAGLTGRDAALATELGYGTLRATGTLDEVLRRCASRDLDDIEIAVLNLLRLGAYQLLRTRIPTHAAVATTVDLARAAGHARAAGFVNAVLRKVSATRSSATPPRWAGWRCATATRAGSWPRSPTRSARTPSNPTEPSCRPRWRLTMSVRRRIWSAGPAGSPRPNWPPRPGASPARTRPTRCG